MSEELVASYETRYEVPQTGELIDLSWLDGWDEVTDQQRLFLCEYFQHFPKILKSAMKSGITQSTYRKWVDEDETFNDLMNTVKEIHAENLASVHYESAYTNPNVRSQQLKSMGADGQSEKTVNYNLSVNSKEVKTIDEIAKS